MKKTYQTPSAAFMPLQLQPHLLMGSDDVPVDPSEEGNQEEAEAKPCRWGDVWSDDNP